jgi:twitching motility protein PilT
MARIDSFLAQLFSRSADALVLEGGNNIFLMLGQLAEPLLTGKPGSMQNEHVMMLLKEIAPAEHQGALDRGDAVEFRYDVAGNAAVIKFVVSGGRFMARIRPETVKERSAAASNPAPAPAHSQSAAPAASPVAAPSHQPEAPVQMVQPRAGRPVIEAWFEAFLKGRASDLHLTSSSRPMVRLDGDMKPIPEIPTLSADELDRVLMEIMPDRNLTEWKKDNDTDFAYEVPGSRLRCNVFRDRRGPGACFRRIPSKILSAEDLNLPPVCMELCKLKKGLVVVTGPTGSGKSTTLAAMVDWVNANRADHIITIEDPIEFVHEPKKCLIHQRQVGPHTTSFSRALRAALREDPDIILVGEMRDLETVAIAIEMAETGHLVFGTLHTTTAPSTIDRIVDQFPADRQEQVRQMLSESLKGVIAQTLCKKKGSGRIAALEILICSTAVSNLIREHKTFQIPSLMQTQKAAGMRTLNDSLLGLVKDGVIEPEEALTKSVDKGILTQLKAMGHLTHLPVGSQGA